MGKPCTNSNSVNVGDLSKGCRGTLDHVQGSPQGHNILFCHAHKAKMPSSQWTRAYCNAMSQSNINKNQSTKKRQIARHANWQIFASLPFTSFSTKFLMDNCVVFNASHNKQHIDLHKDALVIDVSELEIIDTIKGARLVPAGSEADTPLFMLVPREEVVGSGKQVDVSSLIATLETLESNNKVSLEHGKSRYVGHASSGTKYTCSGLTPNHGGKGIHESSIKDLPEAQWLEGVDKVHPKVWASFDWISWFWGSTGIPECNEIWELCDNARTSWNTQECFNLWSNIQQVECVPLQPHWWGFFLFCCYSAGREMWWFTLLNEWWHLLLFCVRRVWCGGGSPPQGCAPFQPIGISLCNDSSQSSKGGVVLFSVLENRCCRNSMPLTELEKEWLRNEQVCCWLCT